MTLAITGARVALIAAATALTLTTTAVARDPETPDGGGPPAGAPTPVQWGDFNGDAFPDALALGPDGAVTLLQNLGNGTFADVTDLVAPEGLPEATHVLFEDFDGDGLADLFLGHRQGGASLLRNLGLAFVSAGPRADLPVSGEVVGAHWIDYDADGWLDLHVVTDIESVMLHATGRGEFEAVPLPAADGDGTGPVGRGATVDPVTGTPDPVVEPASPDEADRDGPAEEDGDGGRRAGEVAGGGELPPPAEPLAQGATPDVRPGGPLGGDRVDPSLGESIPPFCMSSITDAAGGGCLNASSVPTLGMLYPMTEQLFLNPANGHVGIGTLDPRAELHVDGSGFFGPDSGSLGSEAKKGVRVFVGSDDVGRVFAYDYEPGAPLDLSLQSPGGNVGIGTASPAAPLHVVGTSRLDGTLDVNGLTQLDGRLEVDDRVEVSEGMEVGDNLTVGGEGLPTAYLGVGTKVPAFHLHMVDDNIVAAKLAGTTVGVVLERSSESFSSYVQYRTDNGSSWYGGQFSSPAANTQDFAIKRSSGGAPDLLIQRSDGFVGIGTGTPATALDVDGAITIRGGADIVENFESSCGVLEPGTVVAIDPDRPGMLMCSADAYDTKVAGVVSGAGGVNPGLLLGQDDLFTGDTKVAMTGRVYVKCTSEAGPVRPGDRLTTSSLAGHAMRVADDGRSIGAVIGKAMSPLEAETGLVLVLVNLQ